MNSYITISNKEGALEANVTNDEIALMATLSSMMVESRKIFGVLEYDGCHLTEMVPELNNSGLELKSGELVKLTEGSSHMKSFYLLVGKRNDITVTSVEYCLSDIRNEFIRLSSEPRGSVKNVIEVEFHPNGSEKFKFRELKSRLEGFNLILE